MRILTIGFIFVVMFLIACSSGSHCYESTDTQMVTTFTGNNANKIGPILVRGFGKDAVGDTLYYNPDSALTKRTALPLSLSADSTGFVVTANGRSSTFWVRHTMNIQLISQSCGFAPYYKLKATKHTVFIDSMHVFAPEVDPKSIESFAANGQNITIYLHLTDN